MNIMIDCYEHPASSERYQRANFEKKAYLVDKSSESTTYVCFSSNPKRAIHRISVSGDVTEIAWAFGEWDNRTTLNFVNTLNDPIVIDETDLA